MQKLAAVVAATLLGSLLPLASGATALAAPTPAHTVSVTGSGVATYPAYSASLDRFAIRTDNSTGGTVTVNASTSDTAGRIAINGRPAPSGSDVTLSGLQTGDEVNVAITDAGGTTSQSWIYLPAGFPEITTTATGTGPAPGYVFLGLSSFLSSSGYEVVVDAHGVPIHVRGTIGQDLKVSDADPTHYSVARPAVGGGTEIDELDPQFRVVATRRLDHTPTDTDFHDSQLLPGGGALLEGYRADTRNGSSWLDAVIQIVDRTGHATFEWDSKDHVDPGEAFVSPNGDYAHLNSVQLLANGDILASFRNLSQVMRIATTAHDGFQPGDVIWRLGGRLSDFTFPNDPLGGPCAQHIARILPDGHLMLFDNGSRYDGAGALGGQTADMCPDPTGATDHQAARPQTRVTEYALDEQAHTASLVWSYQSPHRYAAFAGDHQRLPNGDTFIGWSYAVDATASGTPEPIASEVTPAGNEVWTASAGGWFSYRVFKFPAPDRIAPVVELSGLPDGATYTEGDAVTPVFGCTDTGGSNLQTCVGTAPAGHLLDTTPGAHLFTVTATDGNGNSATRSASYSVRPLAQPDGLIRRPDGAWRGGDVYGGAATQKVTFSVGRPGVSRTARVSVQNDGLNPDRLTLVGTPGSRGFGIRYFHGTTEVTTRVLGGTLRTPTLAAGQSYALRIVLRRTGHALPGTHARARLEATSVANTLRHDAVAAVIRATG